MRQFITEFASNAVPRLEVRLLLSHVLSRSSAWLAAHDDHEIAPDDESALRLAVSRRAAGEPIAYIIGYREFYSREFKCSPAALIPRPETELLVEQVLALTPAPSRGGTGWGSGSVDVQPPPRILDIGTGTGCIAITLALELPNAKVTALDISRDALALARANASALGAKIEFLESDWFSVIAEDAQFDIIVSNPPYIVPNDPHLFQGDLRFEPWLALQDRGDGLQSYRELAAGAKKHLREGGLLIVEHGYDQGESVPALFREAGFESVEMIRDLAGQPRITRCKKQLLD
ncbi:MAG: peptide chain release factor N(5)-glutamine methyltransferase [Betaproteobacteria bacterium]|nr:MAG: peptide chain release factor N(5)-glutamine methyltransferase [Betaproteobacteria bacterium]